LSLPIATPVTEIVHMSAVSACPGFAAGTGTRTIQLTCISVPYQPAAGIALEVAELNTAAPTRNLGRQFEQ
jgi:hypothetical protein